MRPIRLPQLIASDPLKEAWARHIGVFLLIFSMGALSACNSASDVQSIGEGFGLQHHGSPLPHSPAYVSLLRTNGNGKWITVWPAISYRFEGTTASDRSIVFGGVTRSDQAEEGLVRFLYFSESTGVVDLTDSLAGKANIPKKPKVSLIYVRKAGSSLEVRMRAAEDVNVNVSFAQLAEMARAVAGQNNKRTFDGIEFFE